MNIQDYIVTFESPRLGYGKVVIKETEGKGIRKGITAIYGNNGSGKTTLGTILEKGRYAYGNRLDFLGNDPRIKMLSFSDIHSLSGMEAQYFAQRMESTMNDMVPTVADVLGKKINDPNFELLSESFNLHNIKDKRINYLSSGELRKLIIINALLEKPDVLILDNPYIGLDDWSRDELNNMMSEMREKGISIVLLLCDLEDIPGFADHILYLSRCILSDETVSKPLIEDTNGNDNIIIPEKITAGNVKCEVAFEIKDGHIRYADKQIMKGFDWKIRSGERWVLTGPNGCGKSLLLSMICADNPQGYSNDITLFDKKRGSGESIWEIKDNIGYVSPEMQLFFKSNSNVRDIIAQGLRNSLNRYTKIKPEEYELTEEWISLLGIREIAERKFNELSAGEQRLVLLARALIKQPSLLVLDEPLHGLDSANKHRIKKIIDKIVEKNKSTLIFVTHYKTEIPECVTHTKKLTKLL